MQNGSRIKSIKYIILNDILVMLEIYKHIHNDLKVELVISTISTIKKYTVIHEHRLHQHVKIEAIQLLDIIQTS